MQTVFPSRSMRLVVLLVLLVLAACSTPAADVPATQEAEAPAPATDETTDEPTEPADERADGAAEAFDLDDWESVVAAADGQTVNWYMWGGSESINEFVDTFYGLALKERYNITLNRVPVADAVDFVNQLLSEKEAGTDPGNIDLMWINGENFATLKEAGMLYDGWSRSMPNSAYVNWENPALSLDFGEPIEALESPWSSAQFQFIYDSARMGEDDLPRSYAQLKAWACEEHRGRFTYIAPGPGAFQGTRFVKGALFELSGGAEQWRDYDEALWEEWSPQLWQYFNALEPCLWREGETYPKDENELHSLFANQEVDLSITQAIAGAGPLIEQGLVPETSRAFVFDDYMIGDFNYVAIAANAPNKAAALVLANMILEPEFQAAQIIPENGFGLGFGIDITLVPVEEAEVMHAAAEQLGPAATPVEDLLASLVPDSTAEYQTRVEEGWREHVLIAE